MVRSLEIATVVCVAIAMALSLAHALEWPGKRRLDRDTYLAVQTIYYPGFTYGGFGEVLGLLLSGALVLMHPGGDARLWLTVFALICLIGMQAIFWIVTQPANRYWLSETKLSKAGAAFFRTDASTHARAATDAQSWTTLRKRWEYSHIARAVLALLAFVALLIATVNSSPR